MPELLTLPPHPEPHTHTWTEMEKRCILAWGAELIQAADKAATERAASRWQPIETAPRDATAILVMQNNWAGCPGGVAQECNGHNTYVAQWWEGERKGAGAWICYMDSVHDPECPVEPTHWMPLPEAPVAIRTTKESATHLSGGGRKEE